MWTFYLSLALLCVSQLPCVAAAGCGLVSVTSPSASAMKVAWNSYGGASRYLLDLRVVNSTAVAPVVVLLPSQSTEWLVRGLRPGRAYLVTLKVFTYYTVACAATERAVTVPATSQLTSSRATSSSSIQFEWSGVTGADGYVLLVEELSGPNKYNRTFTTLAGAVDGLTPSTAYSCYVLSFNRAGTGAKGRVKTVVTLVQPPSEVTLTATGRSSARAAWSPVQNVLLYQVTVSDLDDPGKAAVVTETSSTSTDISDLEPCSNYTVGVSSLNMFLVPGEPREVTHATSSIKAVSSVRLDYSCSSGRVTVSWVAVFGASSYRATAVDGTGTSLNCTSASTSCQITMLACGETYRVHVSAVSDDCRSLSSTSSFQTMPCAPAEPRVSYTCSSNVVVFSWQHTNNTLYYVAKSEDNAGRVTECRTLDDRCHFTNAGCGQFFEFQVLAVSTGCSSDVSGAVFVRTSPCLPTNVRTQAVCRSDTLVTSWDSAAGALTYTVEAQGNNAHTYNCTTSSNSCAVTGVPCGEHLSVWIVASNDNCTTSRVLGEVAETVPCTPTGVSASADCSQSSASVSWSSGRGSVFHTAVAQDAHGTFHSCNSVGSSCLVEGLTCGQNYTATVIGTNLKCNSSSSQEVAFMTAPCPPTNIEAHRDCDANLAVVAWQNHQPTGTYTASMEDQSGSRLNCTSNTVGTCKITALPCGRTYTVTVSYHDGHCPSTSTPISMDSVPCGPEDVSATVSCLSGELNVSWNISLPSENYTAIISRGMDQPLLCNSTQTHCIMGGLQCGSSYMVVVFSVTGSCSSRPSPEVTVQTSPCPPTKITATYACSSDPVSVSWVASDSAMYYSAVAVSSGGHRHQCSTNTTSCSLSGLQCGQTYIVGVSGADDNCTGLLSHTVSLDTEPCAPSDVSSQLMCDTKAAVVFWTPSMTATSYSVVAMGPDQTLRCHGSGTNCTLTNLICDEHYQILVTASDGKCVNNSSRPFWQLPVPCAPRNISTSLICGTNDLLVSWVSSSLALNYSVSGQPETGNSSVSCFTDGTSCRLSGLQCGQTYRVQVEASSEHCAGLYSPTENVTTGPCAPQNVTAQTDCGSQSLVVSWSSPPSASTYITTVTGPRNFSEICSSSAPSCSFHNLQCATEYDITVTSTNSNCPSAPWSTAVVTGPCDPANVSSLLHCGSDMVTVSWSVVPGAVTYTVLAEESWTGDSTSCQSNGTSCQLSHLQCGRVYNLTVTAQDHTCNSSGPAAAVLRTAPCPPSVTGSTLLCGSNSSLLSWTPAVNATGYMVNATSTTGHRAWCSSTQAWCSLTDLHCSETYSVRVTARGGGCDGPPGSSTNITTAPCPPAILSQQYSCDSDTAVLTWTDSPGSDGFLARLAGGGHRDSCHTANSSCSFRRLPCGVELDVTVQAQGPECNSSWSRSEKLQTVPCPPTNISVTQPCADRTALVTWVGSSGASGYNVTATVPNGHTLTCHTNSTSCQISGIRCGATYDVTVSPYSRTCGGKPSAAHGFGTGPCAPGNVTLAAACRHGTVSWTGVAGANLFVATATADDGHTDTCNSSHSDSCDFTGLLCGRTYTVTVVTVERGCRSPPGSAPQLKTAPCPPVNLTGQVACDRNAVTLWWAPVSGASYMLQTDQIGGSAPPSLRSTSNSSHTVTDLLCGQRYTFRVAAVEGGCNSSFSSPALVSTAPCQPTNLTAGVDCGTNTAHLSWAESSGAGFHTVMVTGEHGHQTSCSSGHSSCTVKLHCGRSYSATLVASSESCNSSKHADIHFHSAPCLPEDVTAELDCDSNIMNVSWIQLAGSGDYTAWAIADDHRAFCNSTSDSCSIHHLRCGKIYEVAVSSSSVHCSVMAGSDYRVRSAPCEPGNVTVDHDCSSDALTVQWSPGNTAQNFTVQASSSSGVNFTCESAEAGCSFWNLSCGQLYTVTVTGHTDECRSESSTVEKVTEPCPPTGLSVLYNASGAEVAWEAADGAGRYRVRAVTDGGVTVECDTGDTRCALSGVRCGQIYNVTVTSQNRVCGNGSTSEPHRLLTEPCPPGNVQASVACGSLTSTVSWEPADLAVGYAAYFDDLEGHATSCATTNTSCEAVLTCGTTYSVWVTAVGEQFNSSNSAAVSVTSGPCRPVLSVEASCQSVRLSWQRADGVLNYLVRAAGSLGYEESLNTTENLLSTSLPCGQRYNVTVRAQGGECYGAPSAPVFFTTAPCVPWDLSIYHQCEVNLGSISWGPSDGAKMYVAVATGPDGGMRHCLTNDTSCTWDDLRCGARYTVVVRAEDETCSSPNSSSAVIHTASCPPTNVSILMDCGNRSAAISWSAGPGAARYLVTAVSGRGNDSCVTSDLRCDLKELACGNVYTVQVMAVNNCSGAASPPLKFNSGPCPPQNVSVQVDCRSNDVTVSWDAVGEADYFLASLTLEDGGSGGRCNGTGTWCSVGGLACGNTLRVQVAAVRGGCSSEQSHTRTVQTAPCRPGGIRGRLDRVTHSARIWWDPAPGADFYTVSAAGEEGRTPNCTASTNTTCEVEHLACGVLYDFRVRAENSQCASGPSAAVDLQTAPCSLSGIAAFPQCHNSSILVTWEPVGDGEGSVVYTATAEAGGRSYLSCHSSAGSCHLQGARCGLHYTVVVAAWSDSRGGSRSGPIRVSTEPCPPSDVAVQASCGHGGALVSWTPSQVADSYQVVAAAADGDVHTCNSTSNNCSMSGLHCDQQYVLFVTASHENCSSKASRNTSLHTGPCPPAGLSVTFGCTSQSAELRWMGSDGAEGYFGYGQAEDGDVLSCQSTGLSCTINGVLCGALYNFSVKASDGTCNSSLSDPLQAGAAPCPPDGVEVQLLPMLMEVQVLIFSWTEVACEDTEYLLRLTGSLLGDEQALLDLSSFWTSLSTFEMPLPCSSSFTATVESRNAAGRSHKSEALHGTTAPCPPQDVTFSDGGSFATVSWSASVFATTYTVYDSGVTPRNPLCTTTLLSCSLSNTPPAELLITASNAAGESQEIHVTRS